MISSLGRLDSPESGYVQPDGSVYRQYLGNGMRAEVDRNAARQLRTILNEEPDLFGSLGQMAVKIQQKWIQTIAGQDLFEREMILRATMELRKSLIEEDDRSELERLAIEQVISSYLQLSYHEYREAKDPASDLKISNHRANQIKRASRRHMKALGALTTLRLLSAKI